MKIKYLGTAAAEGIPAIFCDCENCRRSRELEGRNIRTRSQAIIDDKILIDYPADTYMHFLKHNIPMTKIKSCIITHSHSDHLYPAEIQMRKNGFSHIDGGEPITFFSCESGYNMLTDAAKKYQVSEKDVNLVEIKPFKSFETDGYKITPVKAEHDPKSSPVVYAIEKGGKSILYCNDTSELSDESMAKLMRLDKAFNVISLDCTEACNDTTYVGHMTLKRCIAFREQLIDKGIADEKTMFILNHFSHNGKSVVYDDFLHIAKENGFMVTYDGLELEF